MSTTVTLSSDIVQAVLDATQEKSKAAAVRLALDEFLRSRQRRQLAALAGTVELRYSNEELEALEE